MLDAPLTDLNLSTSLTDRLAKRGVVTVRELMERTHGVSPAAVGLPVGETFAAVHAVAVAALRVNAGLEV